ncbi:970_t:CDS:2 [Entrophospora sp. SA101]|nr:970_t:CDS:2 [Entrophospora sp. SA101]CAJ0834113.1 3184_t:CDS:2 [Entrophospora sp. SA101]CAJ0841426.1 17405_t:CDS:2 [Entrophospora sp. SA101]
MFIKTTSIIIEKPNNFAREEDSFNNRLRFHIVAAGNGGVCGVDVRNIGSRNGI